MTGKTRYNIAVIDDDDDLREQLVYMINAQSDMQCVANALSIEAFFQQYVVSDSVDLILLDYFLQEGQSVESIDRLRNICPDARIVIITGREESDLVAQAINFQIDGYYLKGSTGPGLVEVVRQTLAGGAYLAPHAARAVLDGYNAVKSGQVSRAEQIRSKLPWDAPNRAVQVVEGLLDGLTYQEIADKVGLSIDGVRYYTRQIYKELNISKRVQLAKVFESPSES